MPTAANSEELCADAGDVKNSAIATEDAAVSEDMFEVSASPKPFTSWGAELLTQSAPQSAKLQLGKLWRLVDPAAVNQAL